MPMTPLFAAILAIIYVLLSFNVIRFRLSDKVSLGDGGNKELRKAIRIHGNFSEYIPFALLLMWFLETVTYSSHLTFYLGCILVIGRCFHVIGMAKPTSFLILRPLGTLATFTVIMVAATRIIWLYIPIS